MSMEEYLNGEKETSEIFEEGERQEGAEEAEESEEKESSEEAEEAEDKDCKKGEDTDDTDKKIEKADLGKIGNIEPLLGSLEETVKHLRQLSDDLEMNPSLVSESEYLSDLLSLSNTLEELLFEAGMNDLSSDVGSISEQIRNQK